MFWEVHHQVFFMLFDWIRRIFCTVHINHLIVFFFLQMFHVHLRSQKSEMWTITRWRSLGNHLNQTEEQQSNNTSWQGKTNEMGDWWGEDVRADTCILSTLIPVLSIRYRLSAENKAGVGPASQPSTSPVAKPPFGK